MAGKKITHNQVKELLGRALEDPKFRARLLSSPEATLKKEGYDPHDAAVGFFKTLSTKTFDEAAKKVKVKNKRDPIEKAGEM